MRESITFLGLHDPVSAWLHLLAAFVFLIAGVSLVYKGRGSKLRVASLILYSFSLIFLFSMSGVFHLLPYETTGRGVLQILDHAAIWILIAGTFVPIHTLMFRGPKRWGVLLLVWLITIPGVTLTAVFFSTMPEWLSLTFYLGLGWIGLLTAYFVISEYDSYEARYIFYGGIAYSVGAVLEFLRWPNPIESIFEVHDIFHIFVIIGAAYHWRFVYDHASWPVYNKQIFIVKHNHARTLYNAQARGDYIKVTANSLGELKEKIHQRIEEKYKEKLLIECVLLQFFEEEEICY